MLLGHHSQHYGPKPRAIMWYIAEVMSPARPEGSDRSSTVPAAADAATGHNFFYVAALAATIPYPAAAAACRSARPNGRALISSAPAAKATAGHNIQPEKRRKKEGRKTKFFQNQPKPKKKKKNFSNKFLYQIFLIPNFPHNQFCEQQLILNLFNKFD
ncbi:hypothetical protein L484_020295 [Morus notabilis]|uniref:Uncharacterized protein n=1 Tax=Morus notabilis TaxID=981085 RepID=W9QH63_9ROSA|nr:hypothetical protein L484_020295 [Morus notabilis]